MSKRLYYSLIGLSILSFIGQLLLYPSLPGSIPIHWDSGWQVNGYAAKWAAIPIALLPLAMVLLMKVLPKIDPRRRNYDQFGDAYAVVTVALCVLLIAATWLSAAVALGVEVNAGLVLPLLGGAVLLVLGNFMPQFRQSYFLGIRTPWTLANAEVWRKTHRLGGLLFCMLGIAWGVSAFVPMGGIMAGLLIAVIIILFAYSYLIYQKLDQTRPGSGNDEKESLQ
ncbi:MAG TPA: SdpI family protein [Candidatus Limiplasma sp.]|nr:SdpI family protein [Candidatus Limiplasma sp.]HRX09142.1 SdpI family protein [Candidatus Limiplasma sp.]